MKLLFSVLLLSGFYAHAAPCLSYSGEVVLRGVLSRHTFPEQPNYESIARGDAKASYFFISSLKPFCVAEGTNTDGTEPAVGDLKRVQLLFPPVRNPYGSMRRYLGKDVVCQGSLFTAISGHHHSQVLLSNAKCVAAGARALANAPTAANVRSAAQPTVKRPLSAVRQTLVKAGWLPRLTQLSYANGELENQSGDAKLLFDAGFLEVESCSGSGLNYCFFNFARNGVCRRVQTQGEFSLGKYEPIVIRQSAECPSPEAVRHWADSAESAKP